MNAPSNPARRVLLFFGPLLAVGLGSLLASAAELKVGVSRVDITPDYPVRLNGFGFRRTESEGVSQKIWAKAMAFEDPATGPAVLIAIDNLGVPDYIHQELSRRLAGPLGLKPERLALTATHTHTAPMLGRFTPTLFGTEIPEDHIAHFDRYTRELIDAMERAALDAWRSREPVTLAFAVGQVGFAANRRTKGGPIDHDLPVLTIRGKTGNLLAIYTSYACHCVTLSHNKISGDWAGFAQVAIEQAFPGTVAITSVGCGADSNPSSGVTGDKLEVAGKQGQQIADEIVRLLKAPLRPLTGPLATALSRVVLPFDRLPTREELQEKAKRTDAVGYHARYNLAKLDRGESLPTELSYPVQTWTFGDGLAMVNLPGEVVVDYSLRLKREFDRNKLWVNAYANDAPCYIPSERVLQEGGYEGGDAMVYYDRPTKFAPGLEAKIIRAVHQQLPASYHAPKGTDGTKPLGKQEALRSFRLHPGQEIELVTSEPMVVSPVAIDWGADGRLWVCEMSDYPQGLDNRFQPGGRVRSLRDMDGDGVYDRAELFLNSLPFPTGVFAWGDGLLVCAAPDLLYAQDTDGDGRADRVVKLFSGFSTENYQARLNSLNLGLDGWIYGANGLLGGVITNHLSGGTVDIRGRDFRFRLSHDLKTAEFEPAAGLSQQGRVRDDWDHWFGCDNSTLIHHFPLHNHYARRNPHVAGPPSSVYPPVEADSRNLFPISRALERFNDLDHLNRVTSACGIGIYRSGMLGEAFRGNAFTCEPVHNLVHRIQLSSAGALFTGQRPAEEADREFLSSYDNWFRPVQVRTGPDGALWIVDMYRFLMEHPRWISPQRLASLDMRAGADHGRLYRVKPAGRQLPTIRDLTRLSTAALVEALDHESGTERDRVQIALLHRRDPSAIPALERLASEAPRPEVRAQALASLGGTAKVSLAALTTALRDADPRVQSIALIHAEPWFRPAGSLTGAMTKERMPDALWEAIEPLANGKDPGLRYQLVLSLGESVDPRVAELLATIAKADLNDSWLRAAILTSIPAHPAALRTLLSQLATSQPPRPGVQQFVEGLLATTAATLTNRVQLQETLGAFLPKEGSAPTWRLQLLAPAFAGRAETGFLDSTNGLPPHATEVAQRFTRDLGSVGSRIEEATTREPERIALVALLGWVQPTFNSDVRLLGRLATTPDGGRLREAALARMSRLPHPEVATELIDHWTTLPPAQRPSILRVLLSREIWAAKLLRAVEAGTVSPSEFSELDRRQLSESSDRSVRGLARRLLPAPASVPSEALLANYRSLPAPDATAQTHGAELFTRNCSMCHQAGGLGHRVGPDLDPLSGRDTDFWVKNILDPNSVVEPRFLAYAIETRDDRTLTGVVQSESATSLQLAQVGGTQETILRTDLRQIRALGQSLMPEGFDQVLPPADMAALLAFLRRSPSPGTGGSQSPASLVSTEKGVLFLPATAAQLRGTRITLETEFQNLGMWEGVSDSASWSAELRRAGDYDVYLDYACALAAQGNQFAFGIGSQQIRGKVVATGPDWSRYQQIKIGTLHLEGGLQRVVIQPQPPLNRALMDLRTVALVPAGTKPSWPASPRAPVPATSTPGEPPRDPVSLAAVILDRGSSDAEKEGAATTHPHLAAAITAELVRNLTPGTPEEYRLIPWLWRISLLTARRNDEAQIRSLLDQAMPSDGTNLRDWQAVVIGGGLINGLSQVDLWPAKRLHEIIGADRQLQSRWERSLDQAAEMAENTRVLFGTRYDALRMLGVQPWQKRGSQLIKYLTREANAELQMGAVSALSDMTSDEAAKQLLSAWPELTASNRELAFEALLRTESRVRLLLAAIQSGHIEKQALTSPRREKLRTLSEGALRAQALSVIDSIER